jgi:hypothetical protein
MANETYCAGCGKKITYVSGGIASPPSFCGDFCAGRTVRRTQESLTFLWRQFAPETVQHLEQIADVGNLPAKLAATHAVIAERWACHVDHLVSPVEDHTTLAMRTPETLIAEAHHLMERVVWMLDVVWDKVKERSDEDISTLQGEAVGLEVALGEIMTWGLYPSDAKATGGMIFG